VSGEQQFARGGVIRGPGPAGDDSVPAFLSRDCAILTRKQVTELAAREAAGDDDTGPSPLPE
jgi:hypothetical protein